MTRAVKSSDQSLPPNNEVTPLVNFLVNEATSASELEELRRKFNETVSPQLKNL